MKIILNKRKLIKYIANEKKLGFVPTMGAFHKGHSSLIKKSNKQCCKTIVSIYVNKPQFSRSIDFKKYPRNLKRDISIVKKLKVDYLFIPRDKHIYPNGINKKIKINSFAKKLCGKYRPKHFESVVDVIERFIRIIKPKKIFLGKKDFQQFLLIKDFVGKKYPLIKVIGCKTIRENNGLALSSRNLLLSKKERLAGSKIYKFIFNNKKKIIKNKITINTIKKKMYNLGVSKIDYIKVLNINKIINTQKKNPVLKVFIAYYFNTTRLIDNI